MHKSGFVGIVGRANVGKSTLLNKILGQKITITANKPQTTRNNIRGIKTYQNAQIIYVDTPGIYLKKHRAMVRNINRVARSAIQELDLAVLVIDRNNWREDDEAVLKYLVAANIKIILVLNKFDLTSYEELISSVDELSNKFNFAAIIPISAKNGTNLDKLEKSILTYLPEGELLAPSNINTDCDQNFLISETIREKLIRLLGDELPYDCKLELTSINWDSKKNIYNIYADIIVLRPGQKAIVIGKGGERLKEIGMKSRIDLEKLLKEKVFLKLLVKVAK